MEKNNEDVRRIGNCLKKDDEDVHRMEVNMLKYRLKAELKKSFEPPEPLGKQEFVRNFNYPKASPLEVFKVQAGYIPKFVWIVSVFPILLLLLLEYPAGVPFKSYDLIWYLSAFMPILAVLAVTETFRSGVYGMAELEMTAKYNLPQILLMRMGILGTLDLLLVFASIPLVVRSGGVNFLQAAVYLLVPWECTCLLTFQIEKTRKEKGTVLGNILCGVFVCMIEIFLGNNREFAYDWKEMPVWALIFCVLSVLLARQIWRIRQEMEEWNLYLTEQ